MSTVYDGFNHVPVLFNECIEGLNINPDGTYIDLTLGGGGHSRGILEKLSPKGRLISFDKDDEALKHNIVIKRTEGLENWDICKSDFSRIDTVLDSFHIDKVNGILADLGVSSKQIDTPERGFSYASEGPLDMRMDLTSFPSAEDVVNTYSERDLEYIFRVYGEERYSGRIAAGIARDRAIKPFKTTLQLASKIASYMPLKGRNEDQHPARRCFQAIRIEVNNELKSLEKMLQDAPRRLVAGGRIAIISFHSLEDRMVKEAFRSLEKPCTCPRTLPYCACGKRSLGTIITKKPIEASENELSENFRAHSAKLRIFERNDVYERIR